MELSDLQVATATRGEVLLTLTYGENSLMQHRQFVRVSTVFAKAKLPFWRGCASQRAEYWIDSELRMAQTRN
jgi:hypothetical protein